MSRLDRYSTYNHLPPISVESVACSCSFGTVLEISTSVSLDFPPFHDESPSDYSRTIILLAIELLLKGTVDTWDLVTQLTPPTPNTFRSQDIALGEYRPILSSQHRESES